MRFGDLPQVLALERRSFVRPWSLTMFLGELANRCSWQLVARGHGSATVVGYAVYQVVVGELELLSIAVAEESRRVGLGYQLLCAVLTEGRARGAEQAFLEVRPSNHAARALYRRVGFVRVGLRKGYYEFDGEDALVLRCDLPPEVPVGDCVRG